MRPTSIKQIFFIEIFEFQNDDSTIRNYGICIALSFDVDQPPESTEADVRGNTPKAFVTECYGAVVRGHFFERRSRNDQSGRRR